MSMAISFSRVVWSTYTRVFFGMLSGMSCSGGGPAAAADASRFAARWSILTKRPPFFERMTSELSSRPYWPKRSAAIGSFRCSVVMSVFSRYMRTSPLASATSTPCTMRCFLTWNDSRFVIFWSRWSENAFLPLSV